MQSSLPTIIFYPILFGPIIITGGMVYNTQCTLNNQQVTKVWSQPEYLEGVIIDWATTICYAHWQSQSGTWPHHHCYRQINDSTTPKRNVEMSSQSYDKYSPRDICCV